MAKINIYIGQRSKLLKKNQRDLWATGFSCRVADSCSRAEKNTTFDCFLVRRSAKFIGDLRQPALFCT
jgi:hypothetical protein